MQKHILSIVIAALLAVVFVSSAAAVSVSVRVEGKNRNLFGASEPRLEVTSTALDALTAAAAAGEFYYHVASSSFGSYVDQIGLYPAAGLGGWMFKVNGALPPIGADQVELKDGDRVLWYWAELDPSSFAGPKTLLLVRTKLTRADRLRLQKQRLKAKRAGRDAARIRRDCYLVYAQDDKGTKSRASGAVLRVGTKTVSTNNGRACLGSHQGSLVYATLAGTVRSNALR